MSGDALVEYQRQARSPPGVSRIRPTPAYAGLRAVLDTQAGEGRPQPLGDCVELGWVRVPLGTGMRTWKWGVS